MNLNLAGREVARVLLHNGVHCGRSIHARVSKCIMSALEEEYLKVQGTKAEMAIVPAGIMCSFADKSEKLIPFSNVYEVDLRPDASAKPEAKK